jgi:hypothetical protein
MVSNGSLIPPDRHEHTSKCMSSSPLSDIPAHSLGSAEDSLGSAMVGTGVSLEAECGRRVHVRVCSMCDERRTNVAAALVLGQMHELTPEPREV